MTKKKTQEEFDNDLRNIHNGNIISLEPYVMNKVPILFRCKLGHEWRAMPSSVVSSHKTGCPDCAKIHAHVSQAFTTDHFKQRVKELSGDEYEVIGEYYNCHTPILMKHLICDHEWSPEPLSFTSKGYRCPKCAGNAKKTTEEFKIEVSKLGNSEYIVKGEYINSVTPILVHHNICNHSFMVRPTDFISGGGSCLYCNGSSAEKIIDGILIKYNIKYIFQYKIPECKNKQSLPFDFAIFNRDGDLLFIIEYQGEQHYRPIIFNGISLEDAIINFDKTTKNDQIKRLYCAINNIRLVEIPYWDLPYLESIIPELLFVFKAVNK